MTSRQATISICAKGFEGISNHTHRALPVFIRCINNLVQIHVFIRKVFFHGAAGIFAQNNGVPCCGQWRKKCIFAISILYGKHISPTGFFRLNHAFLLAHGGFLHIFVPLAPSSCLGCRQDAVTGFYGFFYLVFYSKRDIRFWFFLYLLSGSEKNAVVCRR